MPTRSQYINRHRHEGPFFQQRYQASYNKQGETVRERISAADEKFRVPDLPDRIQAFGLQTLWDKPLLQLSSGEWQRFSVCESLMNPPGLLIIPDLLKGLDLRWQLTILDLITRFKGSENILIFTSDHPIDHPAVVNYEVKNEGRTSDSFDALDPALIEAFHRYQSTFLNDINQEIQIQMSGVNIQYGSRKILNDIHWTVHTGDKWNIQGPNGAGKSTLISLINSDNPQGYSQPILLFGVPYGRHSIWDRKALIAYFGSDFFQYFNSSKTLEETLYHQLKTPYLNTVQPPDSLISGLLTWFGMNHLRNHLFTGVSPDIKRQVLLLATYLKSSKILVLDEPYQDFSLDKIRQNNHFLNALHSQSQQTVIFVTHRDDHKPAFLNRHLILKDGQITYK